MNVLQEAIEELFAPRIASGESLESRILADFWRGVKRDIESAINAQSKKVANTVVMPTCTSSNLTKEERDWMDAPMGPLPTIRPSKATNPRGRYTRRSTTRKPWMKAAVALLADGQHPDQVAQDCQVPIQAIRRFKGTHAEYIEELAALPHGQKRFDYIQKHFGMGMPEKRTA